MAILPNIQAELEAARAENAKLLAMLAVASKRKAISMKVSEKGAISIYGLGRFPVTLYASQMQRLLDHRDVIAEFIKTNANLLATKD